MKRNPWRILFALVAAEALLLVLGWIVWNAVEGARLRAARADIKAAGWPTTIAELRPPPVPEEQNAAPLLEQAFQLMRGGQVETGRSLPAIRDLTAYVPRGSSPTQNLNHADAAEIATLRTKLGAPPLPQILALLQQAAARPACDFKLRYEDGPALTLPQLDAFYTPQELLGLRAWLMAKDGDSPAAGAALQEALRLADHSAEDGLLLSYLVAVACDRMALEYAQAVLSLPGGGGLGTAQVRTLQEEVSRRREHVRAAAIRACDFERVAFGAWAFEGLLNGRMTSRALRGLSGGSLPLDDVYLSRPARPAVKVDYRAYLGAMAACRRALGQPRPDLAYDEEKIMAALPRLAMLTRIMLPALGTMLPKTVGHEARLDAARLGLAAEEHRRATGAYPARLEDQTVVRPIPLDPFTGAAFRYVVSTNGCRVYSLGPDGKDQGGEEASGASREGDIAWRIERP